MTNTVLPKKNGVDTRYEKYRSLLKDFTIMNDVFMRNVLKKRECTEYILQVIMQKKNLSVVDQVIQKDYKNLQGRSAILDCVVSDTDEKRYDVEIQQDNEGASPKRARYHSGLLDMNTLMTGQDFDELPESYVIFITRDDSLGYGLPIYHIDREIKEVKEEFRDESHIIYVNSRVQDDTELGRLMHDLHCKNADEMFNEILAGRVRELKETQKGIDTMCSEMDKIYNEGIEIGKSEGLSEGIEIGKSEGLSEGIEIGKSEGIEIGKIAIIRKKHQKNLPLTEIAEFLELDESYVETVIAFLERNPEADDYGIAKMVLQPA